MGLDISVTPAILFVSLLYLVEHEMEQGAHSATPVPTGCSWPCTSPSASPLPQSVSSSQSRGANPQQRFIFFTVSCLTFMPICALPVFEDNMKICVRKRLDGCYGSELVYTHANTSQACPSLPSWLCSGSPSWLRRSPHSPSVTMLVLIHICS
jgi:hypothetical protein